MLLYSGVSENYGIKVVVTDDHNLYPEALELMEKPLERQLCLFHLRRNISKWLRKLTKEERKSVEGLFKGSSFPEEKEIYLRYKKEVKEKGEQNQISPVLYIFAQSMAGYHYI